MKRNILTIACLLAALSSFAATVNWDGGAGTTSWKNAANWNPNTVPTEHDDVIIENFTVVVDTNAFALTVTLNGASRLTIQAGKELTVGSFTNAQTNFFRINGTSKAVVLGTLTINSTNISDGAAVAVVSSDSMIIGSTGSMGIIGFNGTNQAAIGMKAGILLNNGTIHLSTGDVGITDMGAAGFINGSSGTITMLGIKRGIYYDDPDATFINNGTLEMSAINEGISLLASTNILENNGSVTITTSAPMISNTGSGTFKNNTSGILKTVGSGTVGAARFVNNGGTLAPGGTSTGFMNFTGSENFIKSVWDFQIAGKTAPGPGTDRYDQIVLPNDSTATLDIMSTVLNINFSYTPMVGDEFHILNVGLTGIITGKFKTINVTPAHTVSFNYMTGRLRVESLLPVELASFKAENKGDAILLSWQTASEINNEGFMVTRSADGKDWEDLDFVRGQGTSFRLNNYFFLDKNPLPGLNYYRLRQIDYDRNLDYSPVISEYIEPNLFDFSLFPNPASHSFDLSFPAGASVLEGILNIFDEAGNEVWHQRLTLDGRPLLVPVNLSNHASGNYTVLVKMDNGVLTKRLQLVR